MLPSPAFIPLITIFSFWLLLLPSYSDGLDDFIKCNSSGSFDCGILRNVRYPFWTDNTSRNCRPDGFHLNCSEPSPIIDIGKDGQFRLLQVNQTSYTMTLGPKDPNGYICPRERQNRTLLHRFLKFSKYNQNLKLLYNCTPAQVTLPPANTINSCQSKYKNVYPFLANDSIVERNDFRELFARGTTFEIEVNQTVYQKFQNLRLVDTFSGGFDVVYNFSGVLCEECKRIGGICKFNPSSAQDPSCQGRPFVLRHLKLIIAIATPGIGVLLAFIIAIVFRKKAVGIFRKNAMGIFRKRKGIVSRVTKPERAIEALMRDYGSLAPKRYSFSHIKKITNSYKEKLGKGGYGDVYKGKLPDGRLVAVKVLNGSKENGEEFINEVASISRTSHVNIVSLLGFCLEGEKRALIYEFMPNGSLEKFIFNESTSEESQHLGCEKMYSIAVGIARGLEYLHRGCNTRIIHLDIKPHNILLDEEFRPKISDFGLSKLCTRKDSIVSMMGTRGTVGYIAPEVFSRNFGAVSHKSDIYSYGMMILEMVGGKKSIQMGVNVSSQYFPDWVYKHLELVDEHELQGLRSQAETDVEKKMILVGLWCIQTKPSERPSINKVIEMLEGSVEALPIPPKPLLSSPPRTEPPVPNSGTWTTSSCECPSGD